MKIEMWSEIVAHDLHGSFKLTKSLGLLHSTTS